MSVHVGTGNRLDVVYDYDDDGRQVILGLYLRSTRATITLPDPEGLLSVLAQIIKETKRKS